MQLDLMKFTKNTILPVRRLKRSSKLTGKIKYKCQCNGVFDFVELLETGGKCPRCGEKLVEFNG